ncbi:hypothetical protein DRJ16_06255 [Candidatus Woesearchaeota archaeon]|nr:MAG: hypothetical protein DRJ16_06255 [Candidatus Woesearchaeota archaeon]
MSNLRRQSFLFYESYVDAIDMLSDEDAIAFVRALIDVEMFRKHVDSISFESQVCQMAWTMAKHSIKKQLEGYCGKHDIDYDALFDTGDEAGSEPLPKGSQTPLPEGGETPLPKGSQTPLPDKNKGKDKSKSKGKEKGKGRGNTARVREDHPPQDFEKPPANSSPTLQQVIDIGTTKLGMTKASCEKFYWHFQAKGWRGIVDWTAKLMQWSIEDKTRQERDGPGKTPETYAECKAALRTWAKAGKNKGWIVKFENRTVKISDAGTPYDSDTIEDLDFETNGRFMKWLMRNWNQIDPSVPASMQDGTKVLEMAGGSYARVKQA